jgi:hypothetical protein
MLRSSVFSAGDKDLMDYELTRQENTEMSTYLDHLNDKLFIQQYRYVLDRYLPAIKVNAEIILLPSQGVNGQAFQDNLLEEIRCCSITVFVRLFEVSEVEEFAGDEFFLGIRDHLNTKGLNDLKMWLCDAISQEPCQSRMTSFDIRMVEIDRQQDITDGWLHANSPEEVARYATMQ